jgi:hypothetical protein
MSMCKNKTFNRFLFFSLFFLFVSLAVNSVIVFAAETSERRKARRNSTVEIQVEQREIINHLERIEDRVIIIKKRNK